jgi:hypothetical protein
MLIQILQSKGQLLTSRARPVAGPLRAQQGRLWGVPRGGAIAPRGMDCFLPPIYISCQSPARVNHIIRVIHDVCKHSRYSEVLLVGAHGVYLSLLKRVFYVKILCSPLCFLFDFCYLPIAFIKPPLSSKNWHCVPATGLSYTADNCLPTSTAEQHMILLQHYSFLRLP